jgi:hypothetical protein
MIRVMRIKRLIEYFVVGLMILVLGNCSEPYTPEISKYEDMLVVDGVITDESGPYTVRLTRSFRYTDAAGLPEQMAIVLLKDDQGNATSLLETSPGVYETTDPDFRGIIGRQYQLYIQTSDQQVWESEFVELKKVPEIERLYAEFGEKLAESGPEEGFQIYVDTHDPDNATKYYRYDFEETWEFVVPYPSYYIVDNNLLRFRTEKVGDCWKTLASDEIIVTTSENMQSDIIRRFPVHFVSTKSNRLGIKYSILVRQYSMSREAYVYWKQVKDVNQDLGSIFDKQPAQIRGNVYNVNNPDMPVIGFFEATCVDSARLFITRSELPGTALLVSEFARCRYDYLVIQKNLFLQYHEQGYCMVLDAITTEILNGLGIVKPFECCDCTLTGSNVRPSFW